MELSNALWITLIGMGLVFVAILVLWGLMALLVRVTSEPEGAEEARATEEELPSTAVPDDVLVMDRKRRAAAAAVAFALAQAGSQSVREEPSPAVTVSAWQAVQRARHLSQRYHASRKKVI